MQKESKSVESPAPGKTKVSYVVLKSDSLMTNNTDKINSSTNVNDCHFENNESGPWKCDKCNLDEQYTNYYMYRRHMQDVHDERFDPRICEHCGYKATKRNILMYHMYTKHNVPPPKSMSFPKCQVCSYIALSESLLMRHQINHRHQPSSVGLRFNSESIQCAQCEQSFTDVTELAYHEMSSGHGTSLNNKEKGNYCMYCGKHFIKMNNLRIHINIHHQNMKKAYESTASSLQSSSETETLNYINDDNVKDGAYEKKSRKSQENETTNKGKLEDQQTVILISDDDHQQIKNQDEHSMNNSSKNEVVVQHSDEDVVVYVEDTKNVESSQEFNVNQKYENYQYTYNNDEIVEEVVEELEAVDDERDEQRIDYEYDSNTHLMQSGEESRRSKHFLNSNSNSTDVGEVIQYVEEETEILEYETCSNV